MKMGDETDRIGVSAKATFGQFWGALAWTTAEVTKDEWKFGKANDAGVRTIEAARTTADTDHMQLWFGASLSDSTSAMIGYGKKETEGVKEEPSKISLGLYHNMGGGLRLWYEGGVTDKDGEEDSDGNELGDETVHYLGIRYDF